MLARKVCPSDTPCAWPSSESRATFKSRGLFFAVSRPALQPSLYILQLLSAPSSTWGRYLVPMCVLRTTEALHEAFFFFCLRCMTLFGNWRLLGPHSAG